MSDAKHTPGPWAVRVHWADDEAFEVYPTHGEKRPQIGEWAALAEVVPGDEDRTRANALLIAAAPDLLAALEALLGAAGGYIEGKSDEHDAVLDVAERAIAKAKGGDDA